MSDNIINFLKNQRNAKYGNVESEILAKIYNYCIDVIKIHNTSNLTECLFEVPSILSNSPIYNLSDMTDQLIVLLKKKKFKVQRFSVNKLYIKW